MLLLNLFSIAESFLFVDYAINNKLTPFISMQNNYSLVYREEEREMFPTLKVRSASWDSPALCADLFSYLGSVRFLGLRWHGVFLPVLSVSKPSALLPICKFSSSGILSVGWTLWIFSGIPLFSKIPGISDILTRFVIWLYFSLSWLKKINSRH